MPKHELSLRDKVTAELRTLGDNKRLSRAEMEDVRDNSDTHDPYDLALMVRATRAKRSPLRSVQRQENVGYEVARFAWARSLLLAAEADNEPAVEVFRTKVLDGRLLSIGDVADWVAEQRKADGPGSRIIKVVVSADWQPGDPVDGEPIGWRTHILAYATESEWVNHVPVAHGGVLDQLRTVSESLAGRYEWQPAQASTFVLTGATPVVQLAISTARNKSARTPSGWRLVRRASFEVDPDVPVEVLAAAFKRYRREALGSRARRPAPRGVELVVFAGENPTRKGQALWRRWNETHPDDKYDSLRAFSQALRLAERRVWGVPRSHS